MGEIMHKQTSPESGGYSYGHPWYYIKGGDILSAEEIEANAIASTYRGYMPDDLDRLDALAEPRRSQELRALRGKFRIQLDRDLSRYLEIAVQIAEMREAGDAEALKGSGLPTAISLKHNHLYNDYAILNEIAVMLKQQADLFD